MYRVAEIENASYWTGPEYQILDDGNHRDGRNNSTSAGALYALYSPNDDKVVKPVGEWNTARIVIQGEHVEHWLNGKKIVEATFGSDDWKEKVADSKFAPGSTSEPSARGTWRSRPTGLRSTSAA